MEAKDLFDKYRLTFYENPDIPDDYKNCKVFVTEYLLEDAISREDNYNGYIDTTLFIIKVIDKLIGVEVYPDHAIGQVFFVQEKTKTITVYEKVS